MKQVLFIRPDTREDGNIAWCESGSQQVSTLSGWSALSELADHALSQRVCVLLPASETIFRHFTLLKKGLSTQATPFSWMAEETLIGDVDNLHWTVLGKKGREVDAVAIDAERLTQWLALFTDAGLKVIQILPDAILLPVSDGGSTLVVMEESYWLRFSPFGACEADAGLLPLLLSKSGDGEICCYGNAPQGININEQQPWQHPLVLIQPQWKTCRANMLSGEFSQHRGNGNGIRHAKTLLAAMALLSVGLLIGPRAGMAWMLVQQENQVQQEMTELAQHYFPTLRQATNLKYHFGQNIKKQQKGVFLQLEALEKIKQSVPAVELSEVDYNHAQDKLTLSLQSSNPQALQDFVNRASENFEFSLQPVSGEAPFTAIVTGKYK